MPDRLPRLPDIVAPAVAADTVLQPEEALLAQEVAQLHAEEHTAQAPRSTADARADQFIATTRAYLRGIIGEGPWVQTAQKGKVTAITSTALRHCTVRLAATGELLPRVQYDPTPPTVGAEYIARRTVRLVTPTPQARGAPQEVGWSIKVAGGRWLYWFDNGLRHADQDTLCRTAWPLAPAPFGDTDPVEELWTWPRIVGARHITETRLLAIDGQETVIARRVGTDRSIPNRLLALFGSIAHGPLAPPTLPAPPPLHHDVPRLVDGTTTVWALNPFAAGWRPADEPGVVCGVWMDQFDPIPDPATGLDTARSLPYLSYYTSRDYGASWQRQFRLPYQPSHVGLDPDNPLFGPALLTNLYYAEAGRGFAWVAADDAEAAALGTSVGGVAFLAGVSSLRGALVGPFFHHGGLGYPADMGAVNQAGQFANWLTLPDQRLGSAAALLLAGAGSAGHLLRAAPHAVWLEGQTGPQGAFTSWASGAGDGTQVEVVGLDREFSQAVVLTENLDTGALTQILVLTDGERWEPLAADQQAAWAPILYPHFAGIRGIIVPA